MSISTTSRRNSLLKTLPGVLISGFFLWFTFRKIHLADFRELHWIHPVWMVGVVAFTVASYTLRCVRWTRMMRPTGAKFGVCARVLMTSLAANNILPLRIGDIMRVFTYARDLDSSPSVILSTVILEKLLDIFVLVSIFVLTMGSAVDPHFRLLAELSLVISICGILTLLLGARALQPPLTRLFSRLPKRGLASKVEHWTMLALTCLSEIGIAGSILLLLQSAVIWMCEGMIFVSAARLIGLAGDWLGPWEAVSATNLSYLIPSSPGAIGTFEMAAKVSLVSHGSPGTQAALFGLALHAWLLASVTGAGGVVFLIHRARLHNHASLLAEIDTLPTELP